MEGYVENDAELRQFEADYEAKLEREADEALERIQRGQTWLDWRKVAELFAHGRKLAMLRGHTNKPEGKGYNLSFAAWLDAHPKLRSIDKATRNHAMQCMDQIDAIETWRATLADNQRQTINHPTTVLRRFKSANRDNAGEEPVKKLSEKDALRERNAELEAQLSRMEREAKDADDRDWFYEGTPAELAAVLVRKNKDRSARLYAALGHELKPSQRTNKKPAKA
jgi:hypothetical protein